MLLIHVHAPQELGSGYHVRDYIFFDVFLEVFFLEDFLGPFQGIILGPSLIIINSALNIVYIIKSFFKSQQL
jgi:hypothetical protein